MKKIILIITAFLAFLAACEIPKENIDPDSKTEIIFDNTDGICDVFVYFAIPRSDSTFLTRVQAGMVSDAIKYSSGNSIPFFFTYHITFKGITGFALDFIPENTTNQIYPNIIENETTNIKIPRLNETLLSNEDQLLKNSYILIYNDSSFPVQLLNKGAAVLTPDNAANPSATSVNSGERAVYTIVLGYTPVLVSDYKLYRNTIEVPFSGNLVNFEKGFIYSFTCDGSKLFLVNELEIKYENVEDVSKNTIVPKTPQAPVVTAQDKILTVKWNAVEGAENYEVYLGTELTPPSSPVNIVPGTTAAITGLTNKTVYYVWIKAVNNAGASDYSEYGRAIPWAESDLPAVHQISKVIPGINRVTITWEESGGASLYALYTSTSQTIPSDYALITDKLSASFDNLNNAVIYYFWIRAGNKNGYSVPGTMVSGTPQIPVSAPDIPSRPVLTPGNTEITVTWQETALTESYEVWLGTSGNSSQAKKYGDDVTGTQTKIAELNNNTAYYVWLKSKNIAGTSAFSPSASAVPSVYVVPPQAPKISSVSAGDTELTVDWPELEGALFYEVWKGLKNNTDEAEKYGTDITGTSVTVANLVNENNYYIWIRAKNNAGTGDFSNPIIGKPQFTDKPSAIIAAPLVAASNGQLNLKWQAAERASVYEIWVGETDNVNAAVKQVNDVSDLSAAPSGLKNGTVYYVWIRAKNNAGTGDFSPSASGTPIGNMGDISLTQENNSLTVSWDAVAGAKEYEIYFAYADTIPSSYNKKITLTNAEFIINPGSNCYVWIKPVNASGSGGIGNAVLINGGYGLYKKTGSVVNKIGNYNLTEALNYISVNSINGDKYVIILDNETTSGKSLNFSGKEIEITLMGHQEEKTITLDSQGSLFRIGNNVTLILDQHITLKGIDNNNAPLVYVNQSGALIMNDRSKIADNTFSTGAGGGISAALGASFTMNGGTISGNKAAQGAGVMTRGNFTMNGGSISNNIAHTGGGIGADAGETFTMYDGIISGNKAANGAGIYSWGTFTMHGGLISENIAETGTGAYSLGGGVVISSDNGMFIMNRGTIRGNYADLSGGVHVWGTFTMNSGIIKENSSSQNGGVGVFTGGLFTMNGGEISGNNSSLLGGGVSCTGDFILNNGVISMNTSQFGGGVYIGVDNEVEGSGVFTMHGGAITGNKAVSEDSNSWGGGVAAEGIFNMHGGIISANTAKTSVNSSENSAGGGVAIFSSGIFKKFSFNQSSQNSGIIYGDDETGKDAQGLNLKNSAQEGSAVWSSSKSRNNSAGQTDLIDSARGIGLSADGREPYL